MKFEYSENIILNILSNISHRRCSECTFFKNNGESLITHNIMNIKNKLSYKKFILNEEMNKLFDTILKNILSNAISFMNYLIITLNYNCIQVNLEEFKHMKSTYESNNNTIIYKVIIKNFNDLLCLLYVFSYFSIKHPLVIIDDNFVPSFFPKICLQFLNIKLTSSLSNLNFNDDNLYDSIPLSGTHIMYCTDNIQYLNKIVNSLSDENLKNTIFIPIYCVKSKSINNSVYLSINIGHSLSLNNMYENLPNVKMCDNKKFIINHIENDCVELCPISIESIFLFSCISIRYIPKLDEIKNLSWFIIDEILYKKKKILFYDYNDLVKSVKFEENINPQNYYNILDICLPIIISLISETLLSLSLLIISRKNNPIIFNINSINYFYDEINELFCELYSFFIHIIPIKACAIKDSLFSDVVNRFCSLKIIKLEKNYKDRFTRFHNSDSDGEDNRLIISYNTNSEKSLIFMSKNIIYLINIINDIINYMDNNKNFIKNELPHFNNKSQITSLIINGLIKYLIDENIITYLVDNSYTVNCPVCERLYNIVIASNLFI